MTRILHESRPDRGARQTGGHSGIKRFYQLLIWVQKESFFRSRISLNL